MVFQEYLKCLLYICGQSTLIVTWQAIGPKCGQICSEKYDKKNKKIKSCLDLNPDRLGSSSVLGQVGLARQ